MNKGGLDRPRRPLVPFVVASIGLGGLVVGGLCWWALSVYMGHDRVELLDRHEVWNEPKPPVQPCTQKYRPHVALALLRAPGNGRSKYSPRTPPSIEWLHGFVPSDPERSRTIALPRHGFGTGRCSSNFVHSTPLAWPLPPLMRRPQSPERKGYRSFIGCKMSASTAWFRAQYWMTCGTNSSQAAGIDRWAPRVLGIRRRARRGASTADMA